MNIHLRFSLLGSLVLTACSSSSSSSPASASDTGVNLDAALDAAVDTALDDGSVPSAADATPPDAAARLHRLLIGDFDSLAQSKSDPTYFSIHLAICPVSVPGLGTRVLYVEQALSSTIAAPYRQRLYVVESKTPAETHAVSRIFEFKNPSYVVGLCADPTKHTITPADVFERAGCNVDLQWKGDRFEGGTTGKDCPSTLEGATYASSQATLDESGLRSWDRGYDATDKQVWGAVKGPYVFDRHSPLADP